MKSREEFKARLCTIRTEEGISDPGNIYSFASVMDNQELLLEALLDIRDLLAIVFKEKIKDLKIKEWEDMVLLTRKELFEISAQEYEKGLRDAKLKSKITAVKKGKEG